MNFNLDEKLSFLRACPHCRSFWGVQPSLCSKCIKSIGKFKSLGHHWIRGTPLVANSLYYWRAKNPLISDLVYSLKGSNHKQALNWVASEIISHFNHLGVLRSNYRKIWVPAPPSSHYEFNHALELAKALQLILGGQVLDIIRKTEGSMVQKRGSRKTRRQLDLQRIDDGGNLKKGLSEGGEIIFVDDVIATGSTAGCVYKLLGSPRQFRAWSIVYRGLTN